MLKPYTIKQAKKVDFKTIQRFLTHEFIDAGYSTEDLKNLNGSIHDPKIVAQKIVDATCLPNSETCAWLAFVGNNAVAMISSKNVNGGVYVDREYRKLGIGSALVNARNDFQKERGINSVEASIEAKNYRSIELHKKLGYKFNPPSQFIIDEAKSAHIEIKDIKNKSGVSPILVMIKKLE